MLVVELTAITTVLCFIPDNGVPTFVAAQIALWLWFTVLFANFAEAWPKVVARPRRQPQGRQRRPQRAACKPANGSRCRPRSLRKMWCVEAGR
jgi:K+-transporting ATPase ATPase B chain